MDNACGCFERGALALRDRQFQEAEGWAREGLRAAPDDGRLWQLLGSALWSLSRGDEALDALERASLLVPLCPLARCLLAEGYAERGDVEAARAGYRYLAEAGRCPPELMPRVARGLGQLGQPELALSVCRRLLLHNPRHHGAQFGVGCYLAQLNASAESVILALTRAVALQPQSVPYRLSLVWALADADRLPAAVAVARELPLGSVCCSHALGQLAEVFARGGEVERAEECRLLLRARLPFA